MYRIPKVEEAVKSRNLVNTYLPERPHDRMTPKGCTVTKIKHTN